MMRNDQPDALIPKPKILGCDVSGTVVAACQHLPAAHTWKYPPKHFYQHLFGYVFAASARPLDMFIHTILHRSLFLAGAPTRRFAWQRATRWLWLLASLLSCP
jgi:hypothetical protein